MATKTVPFDAAKYLARPEAQAELLTDAFASGEPGYIANALGIIARARGMKQVAEAAGVSRVALYKALSPGGDPRLSTLIGVARALDIEIGVKAVSKRSGDRKKKVAA